MFSRRDCLVERGEGGVCSCASPPPPPVLSSEGRKGGGGVLGV